MGPRIMEFMGHRIDLYKIKNPALERVIKERTGSSEFMYYKEQYTKEKWGDHQDYHCCDFSN